MSVLNCQIPVSYYIITDNNNQFKYADYNAGVHITITIPVGNYDANTLITYMNTQFFIYPIVMQINNSNGKILMITIAAFAGIQVDADSTSAEIFGIGSTNISVIGGAGGSTLYFPYPLNFLGVKKISIKKWEAIVPTGQKSTS